ncbi:MAG TPA: hypothetical protein VFB99_10205, partial [Vicinamibacterales bacterium]|nr:hypothetical protein [Vicinamibacterales bacterium]
VQAELRVGVEVVLGKEAVDELQGGLHGHWRAIGFQHRVVSVLPNAVVAASMMPVVVAMVRFIGIEDARKSAFASALLIAVAMGYERGRVGYAARRGAKPAGSAVH